MKHGDSQYLKIMYRFQRCVCVVQVAHMYKCFLLRVIYRYISVILDLKHIITGTEVGSNQGLREILQN